MTFVIIFLSNFKLYNSTNSCMILFPFPANGRIGCKVVTFPHIRLQFLPQFCIIISVYCILLVSYLFIFPFILIMFTLLSRNADSKEVHGRLAVNQNDSSPVRNNEGTTSKKVTFGDLVRNNAVDDPVIKGYENDREASANWTPKMSAYTTNADDLNSYSHLPPVLEEPTSSFSEGQNSHT